MTALLDKVKNLLSEAGIDFRPGVDDCGEEAIDLVRIAGNPNVSVQIGESGCTERIIVEARIGYCVPEGQYRAACVLLNEFNYRSHAQVRLVESHFCYRLRCEVYSLVSWTDVFNNVLTKDVLLRYVNLTCEGLREMSDVLMQLSNEN